jgi:peptidyl-prolyl cis-trans isomerase SurA
MQPALRLYLTKLREEAYVELKTGVVDTGASGNEMRLSYSAYTPPAEKKKKKFARARFRGRDRSMHPPAAVQTDSATTPAASATGAGAATTQQASNNGQKVMKAGKPEKIRFGQAPRESLPSSQVASANAPPVVPDTTPSVTTPETRYVNPDGTVSGAASPVNERKTRLSNRPPVKKAKKDKSGADTPPPATPEELASQKVQDAPLGLADQTAAQKKAKQKGDKTRYSAKPKEPDQTPQPYLGQPAPASTQPPASDASHPAPATNPPAPATGPPDPIPPGAQQP